MSEQTALSSAIAQTKIAQLIWLGAGSATQPANLVLQAGQVVLVDARSAACAALNKQFGKHANIKVLHTLLSEHGGEVSFTEYNLAEFSALHSASGLSELFPGLKPVKTQQQPSETLTAMLQALALSGDNNALVIDIADISLMLLKQLQAANLLAHFSQLYLQGSVAALYKGAPMQSEITQWLQQNGFTLTTQDNADPDLPWLQFSLNPLWHQLQQSQADKQQAEKAKAEQTKQLEATRQQLVALQQTTDKKLTDTVQQLNQQKAQHEQQLEQLKQQIANKASDNEALQQQLGTVKVAAEKTQAELNGRIAGAEAELKQAHQQLQAAKQQEAENAELTALLQVYKQWQASVEQQHLSLQQKIAADIGKSLINNIKQIEAFTSLRDLLSAGQMPLNYHGWPISADIALYLAKKVVTEPFDYIIEFGSGTSTVIFAKALQARAQKLAQDISCKVVSFEHNKTYWQKTADDLEAHNVSGIVDLVYAPLVELQCEESTYLYYSCDSKLAEISQALQGKEARILLLIDGPPASTGPLARYPGVPQVLKHLARHQLHIIMDDYVREDEKKAAAKWSKLFEERGIKHQKELLNFEKVGFSWILNS